MFFYVILPTTFSSVLLPKTPKPQSKETEIYIIIILIMLALIFGTIILFPIILFQGFHQIPEGHIGIYFRGGAILEGYEEPGWHAMIPILTTFESV